MGALTAEVAEQDPNSWLPAMAELWYTRMLDQYVEVRTGMFQDSGQGGPSLFRYAAVEGFEKQCTLRGMQDIGLGQLVWRNADFIRNLAGICLLNDPKGCDDANR